MPTAPGKPPSRSTSGQLDWVDFTDFRRGIVFDRRDTGGALEPGVGSPGPTGQSLSSANTFGCYADPDTGWLAPLPGVASSKLAFERIPTDVSGNGSSPAYFPTSNPATYLLDGIVLPVTPSSASGHLDNVVSGRPEVVAALYSFDYSDAGGGAGTYRQYVLGRMWNGTSGPWSASKDFHFQKSTAALGSTPSPRPIGALALTRSVKSADTQPFAVSAFRTCLCFTTTFTRLLPQTAGAAMTAIDQGLTTYDNDTGSATYQCGANPAATAPSSVTGTWPNLTTGTNGVTNLYRLSQNAMLLVPHQGRLVAATSYPWSSFDSGAALAIPADYLGYNPIPGQLDAPVGTASYNFLAPVDENPVAAGAAGALNANTFFAVRHGGGGYVITGDLDNPDIVRLPFLHSTQGIVSQGALTPIGFVYLSRDGAYAFTGAEKTDWVSQQLGAFRGDDFGNDTHQWWDPRQVATYANELYPGSVGRIAWWEPFVVFPNNWMLDTRTNSWWRSARYPVGLNANTIPYMVNAVSPVTGDLFCFPYKITQPFDVLFDIYDKDRPGSFYQWVSHPFLVGTEHLAEVREVQVTLDSQGSTSSTVTVTLAYADASGFRQTATKTATTNTTAGHRQILRITGWNRVIGTDFIVTVAVQDTGGANPAPRCAFRIGYRSDRGTPTKAV